MVSRWSGMKQGRSFFGFFVCLSAATILFPACRRSEPSPETISSALPVQTVTLAPGDSLAGSLQNHGLSSTESNRIALELKKKFNMRLYRVGEQYEISIDPVTGWSQFRYYPGGLDFYSLHRSTDGTIDSQKKTQAAHKSVEVAKGVIQSSLWEAMTAQNIDGETIVGFANIFGCQIDFYTEPQAGDRFHLLYEKHALPGGKVVRRRILAAEYCMASSTCTAVLYTMPGGKPEYFSADGRSLRSAFLRSPLRYGRISSYFTRRRYHPILKRFRPHLGIDYAAPSGTPVSSVGAGTVTFAGWKGGFGKFVSIRHANGYTSNYGHLRQFAKGIRPGKRIDQGQTIGYVGSTGLSTGPHLDFRFTRNGKFMNFLNIKIPTAVTISGKERESFEAEKRELLSQFTRV